PPERRRGARVGPRRGGRRSRSARFACGRGRRRPRCAADEGDRDDEALARPRRGFHARRAAGVGGAAPGRGDAVRGLSGGSAGISGEAGAELQGPVTEPHPVRMLVEDDLHRSRLTVFFRLVLAIPHFLWLYFWGLAVF